MDDAMVGIERDNPSLKDVLPKDHARLALYKTRGRSCLTMILAVEAPHHRLKGDSFHGTSLRVPCV